MKDRSKLGRLRRRRSGAQQSSQPLRLLGAREDQGDANVPAPEPAQLPKARDLPARQAEPPTVSEPEMSEAVVRLQQEVRSWKSR